MALPREGPGKGRILQAPGRISGEGALALVMVDYDDAGRIRLSGEAAAGAALRIYVDNQPAGVTMAGPSGRWDAVLERTLKPGDYTLRLDQLGPRASPMRASRRRSRGSAIRRSRVTWRSTCVIVQPGNSLWRIARRVLGEGLRYVHIFEANQGRIRDPDLIYPGQVFEVPSGNRLGWLIQLSDHRSPGRRRQLGRRPTAVRPGAHETARAHGPAARPDLRMRGWRDTLGGGSLTE